MVKNETMLLMRTEGGRKICLLNHNYFHRSAASDLRLSPLSLEVIDLNIDLLV